MAARLLTLLALACAALALAPGAATDAVAAGKQKQAKPGPTIAFVAPMRVTVGRTLTLRGRGFRPRKRANTVIFRAPSKQTAFAKPIRATRRKLVVRVPASIERLIVKHANSPVPTRFALRVVAGRYGKLTPRRRSPVIVSAVGTPDAPVSGCGAGSDPDGDLLATTLEQGIETDPCLADTDGDGVEDGFEYESALDLNQRAVPYPGKRPFPNALDPGDAGHDYDGDGLSNGEEFRAWAHAAASPAPTLLQAYTDSLKAPAFAGPYATAPSFGNHSFPLSYSDGLQASVAIGPGHPEYRTTLDFDGDGRLTDNERDVDGDGLRNVDEIRALMWQQHYPAGETCGYEYRPVLPRVFLQVDYLSWDSDGDGVWDGDDDQDNDGVSNVDEVGPPYQECENASPLPLNGARDGSEVLRHPYNPCLPYESPTCAIYGLRD